MIILGDCLEKMKEINDKSIDLIVTDPPYLINYSTNYRKDKTHDFCSVIQNDDNPELVKSYIKECYRILKDDTAMYIFCSADKADFFKLELVKYFNVKNMIIWMKNNWTAGDLEGSFGRQYEIIFLVNKGRSIIRGKRYSDIWPFDRVCGEKQLHQNQKPTELIMRCIESHSDIDDVVFDGFAGSGTTAIVCLNTNRRYICIEKEEKYYKIMENRIKEHNAQTRLI